MKKLIALRASERTIQQIEQLSATLQITKTEVVSRAVERLFEERRPPNGSGYNDKKNM